jgi:hypothetical protein
MQLQACILGDLRSVRRIGVHHELDGRPFVVEVDLEGLIARSRSVTAPATRVFAIASLFVVSMSVWSTNNAGDGDGSDFGFAAIVSWITCA